MDGIVGGGGGELGENNASWIGHGRLWRLESDFKFEMEINANYQHLYFGPAPKPAEECRFWWLPLVSIVLHIPLAVDRHK